MTVSDKMIRGAQLSAGSASAFHADQVAQAVIDAAWTDLNINDKSTWPTQNGTYFLKSKRAYSSEITVTGMAVWSLRSGDRLMEHPPWKGADSYAKVSTLMPSEDGKG